jgi:PAS domain S-box-containing protein
MGKMKLRNRWIRRAVIAIAVLSGPVLGRGIFQPALSYELETIQVTHQPWIMGLVTFVLWGLLAGIMLSIALGSYKFVRRDQYRIFDAAFRSLTEGVIVADLQGKFLLFNEAAERILGIGSRDIDASEWSKVYGCFLGDTQTPYPPEQLPLAKAIRGEETNEEEVFIRNTQTNGGIYISINGAPLRDDRGAICGGVIAFRDITEMKKRGETILRLSNAVEQTADAVFITNRDGVIEYVNPAFGATTGYSREEALGQTPRILKSGRLSKDYYTTLWKTILSGQVHRSANLNRKKNGELYNAEQTITPIIDSSGSITHFVSVIKDVTDRIKRQEREIELQYAKLVQQKLYPQRSPTLKGFDIAGAVFSAEATCGDCYDYIRMPNDGLGIAIGDVCGHGIGPALIMAETRAYLRAMFHNCSDMGGVFSKINQYLYEDLEDHRYVTLLLTCIDVATRRVSYVNAGHHKGYVLDRHGVIKADMPSTGFPLGMFENVQYPTSEDHQLEDGDIMVFFTDGIIECEAPDGREFEAEGALEVIRAHCAEPAADIVQHVHQAIREFAQGREQVDDIAIVIVKVGDTGV